MSQEVYAAGLELIGEFIDSLGDEERELTEGEKAYLDMLKEAIKSETGEEIDFMDREGEKTLSAYDATRGGALVGSRPARKQIKRPTLLNKSLMGIKAKISGHNPGDVWRSSSGRWYTMNRDHRVTPTKDPSQQEGSGSNSSKPEEEQEPTKLAEQAHPPAEDAKRGIMKHVAEFTSKNGPAVSRMMRKVKVATMKRLPPKTRKVIKKMAAAAAWVEHKLSTFTHASQAMAKEIAIEKGLSPEQVKKVTNAIKWADFGAQWFINIPVVHHALEVTQMATGAAGIAATKASGFIPVASLAYIAFSTFQDPFATALAADKIIRSGIPKHEEGHEQKPNKKQPNQQQKALPDFQDAQTQEDPNKPKQFDEMAISALCDVMADVEDEEWALAMFCAAVDHTHDPMQAVEAMRASLQVYPSAPKPSEEENIEDNAQEAFTQVGKSPFADRKKSKSIRYLHKAGFTGKKPDKLGRQQCYQAGVHVPCNNEQGRIAETRKKPAEEAKPQAQADKTKIGPSKPEERSPDAKPPALEHKVKPPAPMAQSKAPKNAEGRPTTGYSANGMTNTAFGDMVEILSSQLGMRNILPEDKRSNKSVKEEGSSIDVEYDHSGYAFEIKAVTVEATEYKAAPKKEELDGKKVFAEMHSLKPAMMVIVTDTTNGKAWAYWKEGIQATKLNPNNLDEWNYAGEVNFDFDKMQEELVKRKAEREAKKKKKKEDA
jgi:hypothetical protein